MPRKKAVKTEAVEKTTDMAPDGQEESVLSDPDEKDLEETGGEINGEEISQAETENPDSKGMASAEAESQEAGSGTHEGERYSAEDALDPNEKPGNQSQSDTGEAQAMHTADAMVNSIKNTANQNLKGAVFEVTAAEDIVTQDNQGTHWYDKGDLVTTITTGEGAEFEKECKDITGCTVDEDGMVTVHLPLGKYHVKEKQTLYGYVLPDKGWDVEFTWDNKDEEYVLNATDATDENGVLRAENARAKTQVSLFKSDAATKQAVAGAEFGIFTRHDIYNVDGEKIVDAGTRLGTVTTDADGRAVSDIDFPLMSAGYVTSTTESEEITEPSDAQTSATATSELEEETAALRLNSGDYYLKELSVSGSYYLSKTEYPLHLEYKDQETKVIAADVEAVNAQTSTVISKTSITNSEELPGCELQITDVAGNVIVSWTSGDKDSIKLKEKLEELGYRNVTAVLDEKGTVQINGLIHDTSYTLTEIRPADGYVTEDSIEFTIADSGEVQSVQMKDDTTKIRLIKLASDTGQGLPDAKFEVYDSSDKKVMSFTSNEDGYDIIGKLKVGETYTFKEIEAPEGYQLAREVKYTVKDIGEVQKVSVTDKRAPKPRVPQTGGTTPLVAAVILLSILGSAGIFLFRRKRVRA